ncbi:MAG: hypothetical protein RIQ60_283 [Pseudomonadota bacterium]|jgi:hypothetical protein
MNRLKTLSAGIAVLACAALPALASADEAVALLKNVTGQVQVLRGSTTLPASAGMGLQAADRLLSQAGASAGITFRDGTRIALGPSSELLVRDFVFKPKEATYLFDVHLAHGSALYTSGTLAKVAPAAVKISTPSAMIGVRGTRFIVEAE